MKELAIAQEDQWALAKEKDFQRGLKSGVPIALGYLAVSATFGMLVVDGGLPIWIAVLISFTNLTSAGQFAGLGLILSGVSYLEIAITVFVINVRYFLMSLSLSQKLQEGTGLMKRCVIAFGVTDETFTVASMEKKVNFSYMIGLISLPILGWSLGTYIGAASSEFMPATLQDAFGIALYAMFIALIIPAARNSKPILIVVAIGVLMSVAFYYISFLQQVSPGFSVIICTVVAAGLGAYFFPVKEEE